MYKHIRISEYYASGSKTIEIPSKIKGYEWIQVPLFIADTIHYHTDSKIDYVEEDEDGQTIQYKVSGELYLSILSSTITFGKTENSSWKKD